MIALLDRLRLFTIREFTTHWGRTAASLVVLTVCSAFLVAVLGISGSLTRSVQRLSAGLAGNAALEVSGVTDAGFPQQVRTDLAAVPGVAAAVPMLRATAGPDDNRLLVLGVDASSAALDSDLNGAVRGDALSSLLTVPNGVLAGPGTGYAKGQQVQLGAARITVAAVLGGAQLSRLNGGHYLVAPLPVAQRITDRVGQLDSVLIVAQPNADRARLNSAVTAAVAGRAVVGTPSARAAQSHNGVVMVKFIASMGAGLAFVVSAFLIYNTMSMALAGRRPVISMLRAIGARRQTIVRDVLAEAVVLGVVGGLVGAGLGVLAGRYAIGLLPGVFTQMMDARMQYILPGYAIPVAVVATTLTNVAASAVAARQVYRVSPVEALAPVGASAADTVSTRLRVAAVVAGAALAAAALAIQRAHLGLFAAGALGFAFGAEMLLAFACAGPIVRTTAAAARRLGPAGVLAGVNIDRAPRRVWATLMTVVIAVGMTITITGANADATRSARDTFASLADTDAWVALSAEDTPPTALLPEDVVRRVEQVPGVGRVVAGQLAFASVAGTKALVYGVDPGSTYSMFHSLDGDTQRRVLAGEGIALSRDLARELGVSAGDELSMQTPAGEQRTRVLETVSYFSAMGGTAVMSLTLMRDWFARPGATTLQIDAAPGVDPQQLISAIRAAVPPDIHVYSGAASLDGISRAMQEGLVLSRIMLVIVAFIAAMALLNTLTLALLERRRELGILRAVGSSRRFALRMVLAEAAAIGVVGAGLGVVLGLGDQYFYSLLASDTLGIDVSFRPGAPLFVFAFAALALSLLGSIPPAVRAARLNIVDAVSVD
ncbi:ABC transporter permease [Nocardia seriolae]|uniref:Macrolide export ATP-binding/permease protein MacB n=1 Tax=Nocardia seriolae TaxID=37332 RepID=A0ABC9Z454_9NOCA|nr:ABC transporter permease [Nocardia seriolae]APA97523.1 Macrolide export ATP-binding/permease protein MacB [Nocardia seriolae]OJF81530.1 ABC transporter permease [Nocardia seriolae]PSK27823.1 ABC transporter permease [Nocardia seriolae]QOW34460.1 ABC transporter permease [Nocardia seriolae]QUN18084.1 ABC transporter permease [Nocardia seriolae]